MQLAASTASTYISARPSIRVEDLPIQWKTEISYEQSVSAAAMRPGGRAGSSVAHP
jgi:hypothetical protein